MTDSTENSGTRNPPNRETQFPRYKFKINQNLNFNLYRFVPQHTKKSEFFDFVDFGDAAFLVDTVIL